MDFSRIFNATVQDYHGISPDAKHTSDMDVNKITGNIDPAAPVPPPPVLCCPIYSPPETEEDDQHMQVVVVSMAGLVQIFQPTNRPGGES